MPSAQTSRFIITTRHPDGRFEATAEVSSILFDNDFCPSNQRHLNRAKLEQGPVRIFEPTGALIATLAPPSDAWGWGTQLEFSIFRDELFVTSNHNHQIDVFSRDASTGQWNLSISIGLRGTVYAKRRRWRLFDDHLWAHDTLYSRGEDGLWTEHGEFGDVMAIGPRAESAIWVDRREIVIAEGTPYVWAERTRIELPTNAYLDNAVFEEGHIRLLIENVGRIFEKRGPGLPWSPVDISFRPNLTHSGGPIPTGGNASATIPWKLGEAYPIGTRIEHKRFGIGVVVELSGDSMYVKFADENRRLFRVTSASRA